MPNFYTKKQKDVLEYDASIAHESETINDPVAANVMEMIYQNPDVGSSITSFIRGEKKTFF